MAVNSAVAQTAVDFQGLNSLRHAANQNKQDEATLRQVAGQFEALFVTMMLKSMRQAHLADGIFDSSQSKMYQDMADQQLAMDLSTRGGLGLSDVIMRQLGGQLGVNGDNAIEQNHSVDSIPVRPALLSQPMTTGVTENTDGVKPNNDNTKVSFDSPQDFVDSLWPMAQRAAAKIGVKPEVILSQAALETGWGQHVINKANGETSYNLFNIKANAGWDGQQVQVSTVEYRDGIAVRQQAQFRAYDSYQQSFDDYVAFLQQQPRYQQALKNSADPEAFVDALHKAGYATDPDYAEKIKRIMRGDTLAQAATQIKVS